MRFSTIFGLLAVGTVAGATALVGCGDDSASATSTTSTTSSSSGSSGGPACAPKGAVCTAVKSDCIAITDNAAATKPGLRMAQLTITAPKVLSEGVVANIVGNGVQMNLEECNLAGGGTFSWIIEVDPATGMMKTGGAKPVADPTAGYCFVNETLQNVMIAPFTFDSGLKDGQFASKTGFDVTVPIYLDAMASSYVLMPLHKVILDGTISADSNCIGKYNADKLDPKNNCLADPPDVLAFTNAGHLDGFITLEEADSVIIDTLSQSLCVLLSGDPAMYGNGAKPNVCKRDANMKIVYKGGWCSTTNMAADMTCTDAEKLTAEYAASAVKINGDCK